jgi:hypothetical protein
MSKKISAIHEIKPAAEIVEELMNGLMNSIKQVQSHTNSYVKTEI